MGGIARAVEGGAVSTGEPTSMLQFLAQQFMAHPGLTIMLHGTSDGYIYAMVRHEPFYKECFFRYEVRLRFTA